jgi:hypothetical protein
MAECKKQVIRVATVRFCAAARPVRGQAENSLAAPWPPEKILLPSAHFTAPLNKVPPFLYLRDLRALRATISSQSGQLPVARADTSELNPALGSLSPKTVFFSFDDKIWRYKRVT